MNEILNQLTRWGERGYAPSLHYGVNYDGECVRMGWLCVIHSWTSGSVSLGTLTPPPSGFHTTDLLEAARIALRHAAQRWPEMMEQ